MATAQRRPVQAEGTAIGAYIDAILGQSGIGGRGVSQAQPSSGEQAPTSPGEDPGTTVQRNLDEGHTLEWLMAGGAGAAAALIAKSIWDKVSSKATPQPIPAQSGPAAKQQSKGPTIATPTKPLDDIIDGTYTEFKDPAALPAPSTQITGPSQGQITGPKVFPDQPQQPYNNNDPTAVFGGGPSQPQLGDMDSPNFRKQMNSDGVNATINQTMADDGSHPLPDGSEQAATEIAKRVSSGELTKGDVSGLGIPDVLYRRVMHILATSIP